MSIVLIGFAVWCMIDGILALTVATQGVGILCLGCLFAILARIAQARKQHAEVVKLLNKG